MQDADRKPNDKVESRYTCHRNNWAPQDLSRHQQYAERGAESRRSVSATRIGLRPTGTQWCGQIDAHQYSRGPSRENLWLGAHTWLGHRKRYAPGASIDRDRAAGTEPRRLLFAARGHGTAGRFLWCAQTRTPDHGNPHSARPRRQGGCLRAVAVGRYEAQVVGRQGTCPYPAGSYPR